MKILHTSDWHLGKRLDMHDRLAEQKAALDWLIQTIIAEKVTVLVVAGDVFDTFTPPNEARKLYYHFLRDLLPTACRHVVIIGGNHDSPAMLNADKDILEMLAIYVVGGATEDKKDEILTLRNRDGAVELLVAAVPFLHERDLRQTSLQDTIETRFEAIQHGIKAHYDEIAALATPLKAEYNVPLLATGHLFARNASDNKEKGSRIYVGNLENIAAADFPEVFDYVALGHIHRAQRLLPHIYYAGSLIPLSFSEITAPKVVYTIEFEPNKTANNVGFVPNIQTLTLPVFRQLITIKGDWATVGRCSGRKRYAFAAFRR